jgi:hypothetical protein
MLLDEYLNNIKELLDNTAFVVNQSLTIDKRAQQQAHIFGFLIFINESELHFREFIDASESNIDKLAYSYHLQDKYNNLLFRYDNAKHKPDLGFNEHKHCLKDIIYAPAPHLK